MTIHLFQFNCNLFIGTFALNFYQLLSTVLLVYYWMLLFVMLFNKNVYRIYRRPLNESFISCCSISFTTLYIIVVKSSSASRGLHPQNPRVLLSQKKIPSYSTCTWLSWQAGWRSLWHGVYTLLPVVQLVVWTMQMSPASPTDLRAVSFSVLLSVVLILYLVTVASTRVEGWGDEPCEPTVRLPDWSELVASHSRMKSAWGWANGGQPILVCYIRKYVIILGDIPVDVPPTKILGMCPRHARRGWRQCFVISCMYYVITSKLPRWTESPC